MKEKPDGKSTEHSMDKTLKSGDHVEWNSEAGRVRGVIVKKIVSDICVKGSVYHASKDDPQYIIQSDKTDHVAIHKGQALTRLAARTNSRSRKSSTQKSVRRLKKSGKALPQ